jgi:3-oxoacid CoA-transferase
MRIQMDKVFPSPEAAVADIADGSTVAIAGFGVAHRFPSSLIRALRNKGTQNLCIVANSLGAAGELRAEILADNHQVRKLVVAFSARPGPRSRTELAVAAGEIELELVPQGILAERLRAAGAGIPAFYSPTTVGTQLADRKEVRNFDDRLYVLEHALPVDYALLRAYRADRIGNIEFRGGSQNLNPSFAKGARVAIVEVDEIVEVGEIPPHAVGLPGIFISRVVGNTVKVEAMAETGRRSRAPDTSREYRGKPGLTRAEMAQRAVQLLADGSYVNLGTGLPTLAANYLADRDVMLHAENGILGYTALDEGDEVDLDIYDAAGRFVAVKPGASFFDSVTSFEIGRSGRLTAVILGAYQVDQDGDLANWGAPGMVGGGIGGAMDLVAGNSTLIVLMEHCDSKGRPKLVRHCTYPLTGRGCVDFVVTDLTLIRRLGGVFVMEEVAPGFTPQEVLELTEMEVRVADHVKVMSPSRLDRGEA